MRIAQIAPLAEAVPPRMYGGTERVVSWLTEGLVREGHDVHLFASADSVTTAHLCPLVPTALRLAGVRDHTANTLVMLNQVRRRAAEFDILHFNIHCFRTFSTSALPRSMVGLIRQIFTRSTARSRQCH